MGQAVAHGRVVQHGFDLLPATAWTGQNKGSNVSRVARCPRCLELEDQVEDLRRRLAAVSQYVVASPGPNATPTCEHELRRWLAVHARADAAAGFRAGWARLARVVRPRLREWEARWWRLARENERLRSRLGVLIAELSRLNERG